VLNEEVILTATANLGTVMLQKMIADHAGHYARPDVFTFEVNTTPKQVASFNGGARPIPVTAPIEDGLSTGQIRNERELRGAVSDVAPGLLGAPIVDAR